MGIYVVDDFYSGIKVVFVGGIIMISKVWGNYVFKRYKVLWIDIFFDNFFNVIY